MARVLAAVTLALLASCAMLEPRRCPI